MPLEYRYRVYTISRDINDFAQYTGYSHGRYQDSVPAGFARECMIEFLKYDKSSWFIENGVAINVETYVDAATYQYRAVLVAHMTYEQREQWREIEIIDKLQNSYKNKM